MEDAAQIEGDLRRLLERTIRDLESAGAKDEALGVMRQARGFGVFKTAAVMRPVGRAWRLGVLLLDSGGELYSTGEVTRAIEPGRAATNRSQAGELRREIRRAASRGRFAQGEVINFGFAVIPTDAASLRAGSGVLVLQDGAPAVRWDAGGAVPLEAYLADRVSLLIGD